MVIYKSYNILLHSEDLTIHIYVIFYNQSFPHNIITPQMCMPKKKENLILPFSAQNQTVKKALENLSNKIYFPQ